jgi:hypothetical protein
LELDADNHVSVSARFLANRVLASDGIAAVLKIFQQDAGRSLIFTRSCFTCRGRAT